MANSMTGFGAGKASSENLQITLEMKSVNHRFFECVVRAPRQLMAFEEKIKKQVQLAFSRGRVEVFINLTGVGTVKRSVHADWDVINQLKALQHQYEPFSELSFAELLRFPEAVTVEETNETNPETEVLLMAAVAEAIGQMQNMRAHEGEHLQADLRKQLQLFEQSVELVREMAPTVVAQYKERLAQKLEEAVGDQFDEQRLLTEIALFTDKADINEELTRLASHIDQFTTILVETEPIGRKLDFLLQEMNRETNTIGSKANNGQIAAEVVQMKTILEKMKEQVQNIE